MNVRMLLFLVAMVGLCVASYYVIEGFRQGQVTELVEEPPPEEPAADETAAEDPPAAAPADAAPAAAEDAPPAPASAPAEPAPAPPPASPAAPKPQWDNVRVVPTEPAEGEEEEFVPVTETDANAQTVIDAWITANGGRENLDAVRTVERRGRVELRRGLSHALHLRWVRDGRLRIDRTYSLLGRNHHTAWGFDLGELWRQELSPENKLPDYPPRPEIEEWLVLGDLHWRLLEPKALKMAFRFDGFEFDAAGRKSYRLQAFHDGRPLALVYFDETTLLINRVTYPATVAGAKVVVDRFVRRLEQIRGVWYGMDFEDILGNGVVQRLFWETTVVNEPVDGAELRAPQTGARVLTAEDLQRAARAREAAERAAAPAPASARPGAPAPPPNDPPPGVRRAAPAPAPQPAPQP